MNKEQITLIKKLALLNAVKHDGKANPGAVVGGVLGDFPDLKKDMKSVMQKINEIAKDVNSKSLEEQEKELLKIDEHALDKKEHVVDLFGFLGIKKGEKVRTAFPPGPEKQPHIGHAKALLINYLLAEKYGGEFILRFEDTNPSLVKEKYYKIMLEQFKWVGAKWKKVVYASDYMDLYYKHAEELIKSGDAYMCLASSEDIRKSRETGDPLPDRKRSPEENLELWKKFPEMKKGEAVLLLKIDLKHKNSTMKDPAIFRIIDDEHARLGTKYRVWPNYDFQNSIMDGYLEITHRIRSKEFEMRNELQRYLQKLLGYKETHIYEFARFNMKGVLSSGRVIREKVESGELIGWDDPTLTTLAALKRRGFQPEAIKEFVVKTGITKNEATLTWDDLIIHNRRFLDDNADRYFFLEEPVEITIHDAPKKKFELNLHPTHRKGGRKFETHDKFLIDKNDYDKLKNNKVYRLMECLNFKSENNVYKYLDDSVTTYKEKGSRMLHFLPVSEKNVPVTIMMPDKAIIKGLAEPGVKNIKEGDVIQFERFGFARLDNKETMTFWYTHK